MFMAETHDITLSAQPTYWRVQSVALTVLELLAFNAQKFRGSRDPGHAPFWENF